MDSPLPGTVEYIGSTNTTSPYSQVRNCGFEACFYIQNSVKDVLFMFMQSHFSFVYFSSVYNYIINAVKYINTAGTFHLLCFCMDNACLLYTSRCV